MRNLKRNQIVFASVAIAAGLSWIALLVAFSMDRPLRAPQMASSQSTVRSAVGHATLNATGPAVNRGEVRVASNGWVPTQIDRAAITAAPSFTHVRLSRHNQRGLFAGRGEANARVVLLKDNRALADARVDSQGQWQIAAVITAHSGMHRFTIEQRLTEGERYVTGEQIRVFVPEGFRHTVDVTTKPNGSVFSLVAVAADGDDIGSEASRRFDQFLNERNTERSQSLSNTRNRDVAERGDLLDPAWRWLDNASRSYHREVVPRIKQRGNNTLQPARQELSQRKETTERPAGREQRWDDGKTDVRWPNWPSIGVPAGLSEWFATARRGYSNEVVPRLKGQIPVVTVARPNDEPPANETDAERRERLAREQALRDKAVTKAERERREAEQRRLEAERARRRAQEEAARLAEERRKVAQDERKRAEAQRRADEEEARRLAEERKRALERRSEEERRLFEAERLKQAAEARSRAERDAALGTERARLAQLERAREEEARQQREAADASERDKARQEADRRERQFSELQKEREAAAARRRAEEAQKERFEALQREREAAAERRRQAETERDRFARLAQARRDAAIRRRKAEEEQYRLARLARERRNAAERVRRQDTIERETVLPPIPTLRRVARAENRPPRRSFFETPLPKLPVARPSSSAGSSSGRRPPSGNRYVFRDTTIEYSSESTRSSQRAEDRLRRTLPRRVIRDTTIEIEPAIGKISKPVKTAKVAPRKRRVTRTARNAVQSRSRRKQRLRALRRRLVKSPKRTARRSQSRRCHARAGRRIMPPGTYVVKRGDSLWRISRRHYRLGRYFRTIYRANPEKIRKLNLIFPCQRFHLPRRHRR